jgi:hypothetical protein
MTVPELQTLAPIFIGRLLNTAAEGVVIAGLVWVLLRLIGRPNSGTRFAIWFSALLAIVALPFFGGSRFVASHSRVLPPASLHGEITLSSSWAFCLFAAWTVGAGLLLLRLSVGLIRVILLHELAHLRRWDDWTNLAQKIVKAVFFFHPAVWWIENRLTLEREMACDDIVVAQTASPRAYASALISFAEKLQNARGLALAQALVSRMHQMSLRVAQILDAKRPSRTGLWKPVLGLNAGMLALVLCVAPHMPRVVAFQTQPSRSPTQHMQAAQRAVNAEAQPGVADVPMSRSVAERVAQRPRLAPQARAIPAAFNPRTAVVPPQLEAMSPRKPVERFAKAAQEELPIQETIVILQTTQYDDSGSGVWTLCIWRVGGKNLAERQLKSAIVVSSI